MTKAIYDATGLGVGYAVRRRPDPRIAAAIWAALGDASCVINVGAGAGSYEPTDRPVLAIEPSRAMIDQRPAGAAPCLRGVAEALPVETGAFDAAMAVLTMHHWSDWRAGLREMRRVARRRIVVVTFDPEASDFWLTRDYLPELKVRDVAIMPPLGELKSELGAASVAPVPVPHDCIDGFLGAFWRRPEVYLDPAARQAMSPFAGIDATEALARLGSDLTTGLWAARNTALLDREAYDVGYRLVVWNR